MSVVRVESIEPTVIRVYQNISGTLQPTWYQDWGPQTPEYVSVRINSVSPSGYKLTVIIKINGAVKWAGALGAGESSPTIYCGGGSTIVRVANDNSVTVSYTGTITWIYM
jgi:hypothetical protein